MPFLGGPYVPSNALEGVVKHVVKRGSEYVQDQYKDRSNVWKQQKLDRWRDRDDSGDGGPPAKRYKWARQRGAGKMATRYRTTRRRPTARRRSVRRYRPRRNPRPARYLWEPTKLVKFSAVLSLQKNASTGALGSIVIKANSLNDPFGASGASLPIGLDQWAALYSKYKIVSSMMQFEGHPSTVTGSCVSGLHLTDDSTALTDFEHYLELPKTTYRMTSPDIDVFRCRMGYSAKKFWSFNKIRDEDEQEGAFDATPGDPDKIAYYHVFIQDINKTDNVVMDTVLRLTFTALLYDRIMPARSTM